MPGRITVAKTKNPGCNDVANDVVFVSQSDEVSGGELGDGGHGNIRRLWRLVESPPQYRLFVGPPEDPSWGIKDEVGPSDFFTTLNEDFPLAIPPKRP